MTLSRRFRSFRQRGNVAPVRHRGRTQQQPAQAFLGCSLTYLPDTTADWCFRFGGEATFANPFGQRSINREIRTAVAAIPATQVDASTGQTYRGDNEWKLSYTTVNDVINYTMPDISVPVGRDGVPKQLRLLPTNFQNEIRPCELSFNPVNTSDSEVLSDAAEPTPDSSWVFEDVAIDTTSIGGIHLDELEVVTVPLNGGGTVDIVLRYNSTLGSGGNIAAVTIDEIAEGRGTTTKAQPVGSPAVAGFDGNTVEGVDPLYRGYRILAGHSSIQTLGFIDGIAYVEFDLTVTHTAPRILLTYDLLNYSVEYSGAVFTALAGKSTRPSGGYTGQTIASGASSYQFNDLIDNSIIGPVPAAGDYFPCAFYEATDPNRAALDAETDALWLNNIGARTQWERGPGLLAQFTGQYKAQLTFESNPALTLSENFSCGSRLNTSGGVDWQTADTTAPVDNPSGFPCLAGSGTHSLSTPSSSTVTATIERCGISIALLIQSNIDLAANGFNVLVQLRVTNHSAETVEYDVDGNVNFTFPGGAAFNFLLGTFVDIPLNSGASILFKVAEMTLPTGDHTVDATLTAVGQVTGFTTSDSVSRTFTVD